MLNLLSPRLKASPAANQSASFRACLLASLMALLLWTRATTRYADLYELASEKQVKSISDGNSASINQETLLNDKKDESSDHTSIKKAKHHLDEPSKPSKAISTKAKAIEDPQKDVKESEEATKHADMNPSKAEITSRTATSRESIIKQVKSKAKNTTNDKEDTHPSVGLSDNMEDNSSPESKNEGLETEPDPESENEGLETEPDYEDINWGKSSSKDVPTINKDTTETMDTEDHGNNNPVDKSNHGEKVKGSLRGQPSTHLGLNVTTTTRNEETYKSEVPKIIWLMSFPNSGTTYTNKMVQGITKTTTATNYGQEQGGHKTSIPISPDLPDGPFLRYPEWDYSEYVLTKTHCTGYCNRCTPSRYVLTASAFERGCRSGNKRVDNKSHTTRDAPYPSDLPKKAVHILRNPMDNIVARLHMERKNWANHGRHDDFLKVFQSDKEGFQKYCKFLHITGYNITLQSDLLDDRTKELFGVVPCAAEFYRYVQWHNLAFEVAEKRLHLPVHTMFYEDYSTNFNQTADQLLDFLQLQAVSDPPPFIKGKEYRDYFSEDQQYNIGLLVKHLANNNTWALLKHYFEGILDEKYVS